MWSDQDRVLYRTDSDMHMSTAVVRDSIFCNRTKPFYQLVTKRSDGFVNLIEIQGTTRAIEMNTQRRPVLEI